MLAWLAQRAYEYQTRKRASFVHQAYSLGTSVADRFTGAAALATDLDALVHDHIAATNNPYQLVKATFSLLHTDPGNLRMLQQTGRCLFAIDHKQLDLRFPGLYLHAVKRVEASFDGLLPSTGLRGVLTVVNNALVRVPYTAEYVYSPADAESLVIADWAYPVSAYPLDGTGTDGPPAFVMRGMMGHGYTQILSEYRRDRDGAVLAPPPGALDTLENLSVAGLWGLELPRQGNEGSFQDIADVRLTVYFHALRSDDLAQRQAEALQDSSERVHSALTRFASWSDPESLEVFGATPADSTLRDVRVLTFQVGARDLPQHLKEAVLQNLTFAFLGVDGQQVTVRVAASPFPFGARAQTTLNATKLPDGVVFSAVGHTALELPQVNENGEMIDSGGMVVTNPASQDTIEVVPALQGTFSGLDAVVGDVDNPADSANFDNLLGQWSVKVLPEDNSDLLLLDDDGDPIEVTAGELQLTTGGTAEYTGGAWKHAELTCTLELGEGTLTVQLRDDGGTSVAVALEIEVEAGTGGGLKDLTLTLSRDTETEVVATVSDATLDAAYSLVVRVYGPRAVVLLDGVEVAALDLSYSGSINAGTVSFAFTSATAGSVILADVRVRKLRYDGSMLEDVVDERFEDTSAWTLSGSGVTRADAPHNLLDLSFVLDAILSLDYTAAVAFVPASHVTE